MAEIALVAASVFSAFGAISEANSQSNALQYQADIANQNASIAEQNALREREAAALEEQRQRDTLRRTMGSASVARAKSGITQTGSALFVEEDSMIQGELDALLIRHRGELSANNFRIQASQMRSQANSYKSQAKDVKKSGLMKAAGTVLTGWAAGGGKSPFAGGGTVKAGWNPATQPKYVA